MPTTKKRRPPAPRHPSDGHDDRPMAGPLTGPDEDGSVTISRTADGVVLLPRSVRLLKGDARRLFGLISRDALVLRATHDALEGHVHAARAEGVSWSAIGWALGLTGAAARMRYGYDR